MINDDCPESIDCDNELCSMSVTTGYRLFDESVDAWNRRADLPPTLAQALALPEIAALVAAAQNLHDYGTVLGKQKYHRAMSDALAKVRP
jgi:hypothetical protein